MYLVSELDYGKNFPERNAKLCSPILIDLGSDWRIVKKFEMRTVEDKKKKRFLSFALFGANCFPYFAFSNYIDSYISDQ